MRRDLSRLVDTTFDLLVVGGGIQGAFVAWDACLRGLSVAIVDQDDFGSRTSANSLRIVHGGLRYLTRADLPRMLESVRERSTLLRIAPGLVEPLPVLVPTSRAVGRSRLAFGAALALNDLVSATRNRGLEPDRVLPSGRLASRDECLRWFPWLPAEGLTGGALWYDAQLRHPERLALALLSSAAGRGTIPANYVRIDRIASQDGAVVGAVATDLIQGSAFEVRARAVVVAAGPWTQQLIGPALGSAQQPVSQGRTLAVNIVIGRRLADVAVGVQARSGPQDDPICGGHRYLFSVPLEVATLIGTWYGLAEERDVLAACERGAHTLLREFTEACSGLNLSTSDLLGYQWGWLPLKARREPGRPLALAERPRITDHRSDGLRRLYSVEGVKFTTARSVAQRVVDKVFAGLGRTNPPCRTSVVRVVESNDAVSFESRGTINSAPILRAVRQEMAVKLSDLVFRRTQLAAQGLNRGTVQEVARLAGAELGWDDRRQEAEIDEVMRQAGAGGLVRELVG